MQTILCGMDNATPPPCKMDNATPSPSGMDNAIFSPSEMDNATPSPCGMDNVTPSPCRWLIVTCLESITPVITTVDTLLLRVFVPLNRTTDLKTSVTAQACPHML